jgi:hypothetical protein
MKFLFPDDGRGIRRYVRDWRLRLHQIDQPAAKTCRACARHHVMSHAAPSACTCARPLRQARLQGFFHHLSPASRSKTLLRTPSRKLLYVVCDATARRRLRVPWVRAALYVRLLGHHARAYGTGRMLIAWTRMFRSLFGRRRIQSSHQSCLACRVKTYVRTYE